MKNYHELLERILAATDDGKRIFTDLLPNVIVKGSIDDKKFSIRYDDDTPSAMLCPPNKKYNDKGWHLVDFGRQGGRWSAVKFYMLCRRYNDDQFMFALHELAERYGVRDELNPHINIRHFKVREATPEEKCQPPHIEFFDGFDDIELGRIFVPKVKEEHLRAYGWKAVKKITRISKDGKFMETTADPATYPIFAMECHHTDEKGNDYISHHKIYEPFNPQKEYRFSSIGDVPADYMYGRDHLLRLWRKGGEEKLPVVLVATGCSDAVCALPYGYPAVWFNSETRLLKPDELAWLMKYCKRVVYVADIDSTGIVQGIILALLHPTLYTAWINPKELGGLHDARGKLRKDLKDYLTLHPHQKDMDRLVQGAKRSQFWIETKDEKSGKVTLRISETYLVYFLWLHGYCQLDDDTDQKPRYIHIKDNIVKEVECKKIHSFLQEWCEREGVCLNLQDMLMKCCRTMITSSTGHLKMRDDLDFTKCTAKSQKLFFRNGWVLVTADGIRLHRYSDLSDSYVWEDAIIPHDYRDMKPMFKVVRQEDGSYSVEIAEEPPSKFFRFVINASRLHWRAEDEEGRELTAEEHAEEHQCLASKLACIGYLLYGYKSESEAWAPFCQDTKLAESEAECNGGSGKSVFLKAISSLLKKVIIEARVPSIVENRFIFDGVSEDTDLVIVDECALRLNYDFFFGRITGDFTGEEKGNHPFQIPFSKSPKFAFATNYVLKRHDASTERRIWPQVFSDYYHQPTKQNDYRETRTIRDDLGCNLMGIEYSEQDWQADIAFMLQCLQFYMSLPKGERRILPPLGRIERREQMAAVGKDFKQWADNFFAEDSGNLDCKLRQVDVLSSYNLEATYQMKMGRFTQKLKEYCAFAEHIHCLNPTLITGKAKDGDRWVERDENGKLVQYYYIQSAKAAAEAAKQEPVQQELAL